MQIMLNENWKEKQFILFQNVNLFLTLEKSNFLQY